MANTSPIFEVAANNVGTQFTITDTTAKKTVFTAGASGARIDAIICCTNDTAAVNMACYLTIGGTDYYIGNINLPAGSGYTTVAIVQGMPLIALLGYIFLPASAVLKMNCVATMTTAKTTDITVQGGDY